jgi:hypothetical protein
MPAKRLSMRKIKAVLRLRHEKGLSNRAIARSCSVNHRTVAEYLKRFEASGLPWPLPEDLDHESLQRKLFPERQEPRSTEGPQMPDMKYLHRELRRKGVTPLCQDSCRIGRGGFGR